MPLTAAAYSLAPYRPIALDDLVRVGRDHDGGYVISRRTITASRVLVGFGINDDWSFETAFVREQPHVRVVGVDGSVSPAVFRGRARPHLVRAAAGVVRARRSLVLGHWAAAREQLALARDMTRFFDGRRHVFVPRFLEPQDGPQAISWATLAGTHGVLAGDGCDVFLKMDIEGAEYRTLEPILADAHRIAGLVLEVHDCDTEWDRFAALMAALDAPFALAHIHGNNYRALIAGTRTPRILELTFVNRRLLDGPPVPSTARYPIPGLDRPNDPTQPDYPLDL